LLPKSSKGIRGGLTLAEVSLERTFGSNLEEFISSRWKFEWRYWNGGTWGISVEAVEFLLGDAFIRTRLVIGEEKGYPSAWYWYRQR
jgi:hypothetical protein